MISPSEAAKAKVKAAALRAETPDNDAEERFAIEQEADATVNGTQFPPVNLSTKTKSKALAYSDGAEIAKPLPRTPWLVRDLQIAPGRPTLWTAPAGSGKTYLGQSLALAVAAGLPSWLSTFAIQSSGPVLHLNLEMPRNEVFRRYQRLARSMGLDVATLPLRVTNRLDVPQGLSLMSGDIVDVLAASVAGVKLCLIDSFRAFIGGMDENKSEVRSCLDVLLAVTERTDCTFIVIHHEGKPPKEGQGSSSVQGRARGSSAIVDACDTTFSIGHAPFPCGMRIEQGKASMGEKAEPFFVKLEDSGPKDEDGRSHAIAVEFVHPEEAEAYGEQESGAVKRARAAIIEALGIHGALNIRQIEKGKTALGKPFVRGAKDAKTEAVTNLLADGLIVERRNGGQRSLCLP